jgi:hypothetical protein
MHHNNATHRLQSTEVIQDNACFIPSELVTCDEDANTPAGIFKIPCSARNLLRNWGCGENGRP